MDNSQGSENSTSKALLWSDDKTVLTYASTLSLAAEDDIFDSISTIRHEKTTAFTLYRQRWLVLASYCTLNLSNGWICLLWSPMISQIAKFWGTTVRDVDTLGGIYMFVSIPGNILFMWFVVNYLGLARGLRLGAFFNMMGSTVIYQSSKLAQIFHATEYQMVFLGTFFGALAQAFTLPMIALLSGSWFGEWERARATSLGSLAFQAGSLLAMGSTAVVDFRIHNEDNLGKDNQDRLDGSTLDRYLHVQWMLSIVAFALICINLQKDRPPTPPSEAAATLASNVHALNYQESIQIILQSESSRTYFVVFGLVVGTFYALPLFLSQFMSEWSPRAHGMLGCIFQIAAVLGCFTAGWLVPSFHFQYRKIALYLLGGCLVSTIAYLVSVKMQSYFAMIASGALGFFFSSFMSVGIEFGTALTFPADEAAVYGILDCTGEFTGFFLVNLGANMSQAGHTLAYCGALVILVAAAFAILFRLQETIRRPSCHFFSSA